MHAFTKFLISLSFLVSLSGCVVGQSLQTSYESPVANATTSAGSVLITVTDDRPFVKSGEKPPYYLGKYRAGFGIPWDVKTENEEPLASILARDLATDLAALGHRVVPTAPADRLLVVSIRDWNFDGYQNGRLWYDLQITALDSGGKHIVASTIQEAAYIKGSFWMGARGGFEREMPKLYPTIIRKIVRDNVSIATALMP
jgi:hypothetical protein